MQQYLKGTKPKEEGKKSMEEKERTEEDAEIDNLARTKGKENIQNDTALGCNRAYGGTEPEGNNVPRISPTQLQRNIYRTPSILQVRDRKLVGEWRDSRG